VRAATADEIKEAYHSLARQYHPDRFSSKRADLRSRIESAFARIAQAYEVLGDPLRRSDYDQSAARILLSERQGAYRRRGRRAT